MKRLKLRNWLLLSSYRRQVSKNLEVPKNLLDSLRLCDQEADYEVLPWYQSAEALFSIWEANEITIKFPILSRIEGSVESEVPWDYPEREWYYWAHRLSSKYGWGLEYVAELDINDAIALLQEIEVENQLGKEWEYHLSEIAYTYDKTTKKTKFNPLKRPRWMDRPVEMIARIRRFPKEFMPVGNVVLDENSKLR